MNRMNTANRQRHMTAFYLETVLMVIIFVLVISVLAQVFGQARVESREAAKLTNAVCLAQNAAEAVAAADSRETLDALLNEKKNTEMREREGGSAAVYSFYDADMRPVTKGEASNLMKGMGKNGSVLLVRTTWEPQDLKAGTFVNSAIDVYSSASREPLYTLHTGVYLKKDKTRNTEQEAAR